LDLLTAFDSLERRTAAFVADHLVKFTARRDAVQNASLQLRCGPEILHAASGLMPDLYFQYPAFDWESPQDSIVTIQLNFAPLLLARLARLGRADDPVSIHSDLTPYPLASFERDEIKGNFVDVAYLDLLESKVGRNHWWVDACFAKDGKLHVLGFAIPPRGWRGGLPEVHIDGERARVEPATSSWARDTYWFLAGRQMLGFYAVADCRPYGAFSRIDLVFPGGDAAEGIRRFPYFQIVGGFDQLTLPLPANENIHRVSGPNSNQASYVNGGKTDFERFKTLISEQLDSRPLSQLRVLDWGVGCGRLSRYFIEEGASVVGIDIDAGNIAWCRENLKPGEFLEVELMPPTRLRSNDFDVIISSSVLSHLTEDAMHAWLQELNRVLKPNGVALLSFNGSGNAYLYCSTYPPAIKKLGEYGLFDEWRTPDLDGFVEGAEDYYRFTAMTDAKAESIFDQNGVFEGFVPGVTSMHQDIGVLRKRVGPADLTSDHRAEQLQPDRPEVI
jgi:SAM-dependent methyltransferase